MSRSGAVLGGTIKLYCTHPELNPFGLPLALQDLLGSLEVGLNRLLVQRHQDRAEQSKEPLLRDVNFETISESCAYSVRHDKAIRDDRSRTGNRPRDDFRVWLVLRYLAECLEPLPKDLGFFKR